MFGPSFLARPGTTKLENYSALSRFSRKWARAKTRDNPTMRFAMGWLVLCVACEGVIGGDDPPGDGGTDDAFFVDTGDDTGLAECGETGDVIVFFENTCAASGACHQPGAEFPNLTRTGLSDLVIVESNRRPGMQLIEPGSPEDSFLYHKMAGTQGEDGGALMPAGTDTPSPSLGLIQGWIESGAPTDCDAMPPPRLEVDPNTLDREQLFTCDDATAPRSSPGRLRRIESLEFTHMTGHRLDGYQGDTLSTVRENPLRAPIEAEYLTYAKDVSVDAETLDLLMLNLPEASQLYITPTFNIVFRNSELFDSEMECMFEDAEPDDACMDRYLTLLMSRGAGLRSPSTWEFDHTRAFLVDALAAEADPADRTETLRHVVQTFLLTTGALFRSEVGEEVDGRRRLTNEEMALALGRMLSTHPVGSLKTNAWTWRNADGDFVADPDYGRQDEGWLAGIRAAAADGSIQDPTVRAALLRQYAGGIDPQRHDVFPDTSHPWSGASTARGQYWLATELIRFFREWLDYEGGDTTFKDTPAATSRFDGHPEGDRITSGFGLLQNSPFSAEPELSKTLDDTIARVVIESDEDGTDVFTALMTARTWRLPSTGAHSGADCDSCSGVGMGCSVVNDCRAVTGRNAAAISLAFDVDRIIDPTLEGRWVDMPADQRLGVLTHPAWLAAHGGNFEDDASLVLRGHWIRERLFCQTVAPLSLVQVEAQLIPSDPANSARERIRQSIETNETCMSGSCHARMNSLGKVFELFNHAGFLRETDHGAPPDGSTVIDNLPTIPGDSDLNGSYDTPFEFISAVADSRLARQGFIRHAFRYFMGRPETLADACTLVDMENALDADGSFISMMEALVSSETFAYRHIEGEGE